MRRPQIPWGRTTLLPLTLLHTRRPSVPFPSRQLTASFPASPAGETGHGDNYEGLLIAIEGSGFKSNHVSPKELDLIIKLEKEYFHPDWNTIATTFNERSMDQIRSILHYFDKTNCMPNTVNSILLKKAGKEPASINSLSMFLNPIEHTKLSMTAQNVILRTKENDSASFCSIQ